MSTADIQRHRSHKKILEAKTIQGRQTIGVSGNLHYRPTQ